MPTVNDETFVDPLPSVNFAWSPIGSAITYTIGGHTYPPVHQVDGLTRASDSRYNVFRTAINTLLTFTPTVKFSTSDTVLEYHWDFGDGVFATGSSPTHTYKVANPQVQVSLRILDSRNRWSSVAKLLNLR